MNHIQFSFLFFFVGSNSQGKSEIYPNKKIFQIMEGFQLYHTITDTEIISAYQWHIYIYIYILIDNDCYQNLNMIFQ